MKYHVNGKGEPGSCRAEKNCPFGDDSQHYTSAEGARAAYESKRGESTLPAAKSKPVKWSDGDIKLTDIPSMSTNNEAVELPAGRYFVGDPCYPLTSLNKTWSEFVDRMYANGDGSSPPVAGSLFNGKPVVGAGTKYGDGSYSDQNGHSFGVDAGMIGVVHEDVIKNLGVDPASFESSGMWLDAPRDFTLRNDDGRISIGDIVIDTGDEGPDEDEQWDEDNSDFYAYHGYASDGMDLDSMDIHR